MSAVDRLAHVRSNSLGLIQCVRQGSTAEVQRQLTTFEPHEYEIDFADRTGRNALLHACSCAGRAQHEAIAQLLLEHGASASWCDSDQTTPLHLAAAAGAEDLVRSLLDADAAASARNRRGRTPQDEATTNGHTAVATMIGEAAAAQAGGGLATYHAPNNALQRAEVTPAHCSGAWTQWILQYDSNPPRTHAQGM